MANQMLVDATHPEETRVVVVRGNRVEEFDFESANRKQLRGNIYLAKVTRVEPSLQAAFVDYGGNRHGFLAFSEIHPDYYQIPVADRQALLEEEKGHGNDDDDVEASSEKEKPSKEKKPRKSRRRSSRSSRKNAEDKAEAQATEAQETTNEQSEATDVEAAADAAASSSSETTDAPVVADAGDAGSATEPTSAPESAPSDDEAFVTAYEGDEAAIDLSKDDASDDSDGSGTPPAQAHAVAEAESVSADPEDIEEAEELDDEDHVSFEAVDDEDDEDDDSDEESDVEHVGAEDALEEVPERRSRRRTRQYKIQEVIKRRQILLVQVVKEERGNKGAALTTYLSLAGRYSVLMPNTARGGGISRKITNVTDRKRLKQIASDLEVADGMGVILRTAGASRTKTEIKRDFEYLLRLWENVRDLTLKSAAPLLVYEEGSLIKRSIRDLYNKDIDQVLVAGDEGYKEAKGFMKMLMPSHARNVQPYREPQPIFTRMGIESQLDAMFSPQVTLKSGGYIVIDQTEALVSIDVNSGRSTREHNIEDTALSTNLEAAEEISRQLRLRDLAGLVVIDFIDMEEKRNNRAVEKRLKDCLKSDRARIQVGRISHFGLLEMSRQRIRTGVLESTMDPCPHCHGTGYVRAAASVALLILRTIEDHLLKGVTHHVVVKTRTNVALYILNQKRNNLFELENRFGVSITIEVDDSLEGKHLEIERGEPLEQPVAPTQTVSMILTDDLDDDLTETEIQEDRERDEESSSKKRRRRRRRRKSNSDMQADAQNSSDDQSDDESDNGSDNEEQSASDEEGNEDKPKKSRRRGRRGGRRNRRNRNGQDDMSADGNDGETNTDADGDNANSNEASSETPSESGSVADTAGDEATQAESTDSPEPVAQTPTDEAPVADTPAEAAPAEAVEDVVSDTAAAPVLESEEAAPVVEEKAEAVTDSQPEEAAPATESSDAAEAESEDDAAKAPEGEGETPETSAKASTEQEETKPEDKRPKRSGWWNRSGFL
ncbi:ribonuclease E/G [Cohaesibacter intestini]|uniref:ribonuclease E/G n=2 Tax=Cohaesibacter TaxID=655352 RepID=UPI000DE8FD51|nr:ribonuclease E/G [Cohaesibacter intestini]